MRVDGNLRQAFAAMHLAMQQGYQLTIRQTTTGLFVQADPAGPTAAGQKPRTGHGQTLADAMTELTKKMGLKLPPMEG